MILYRFYLEWKIILKSIGRIVRIYFKLNFRPSKSYRSIVIVDFDKLLN